MKRDNQAFYKYSIQKSEESLRNIKRYTSSQNTKRKALVSSLNSKRLPKKNSSRHESPFQKITSNLSIGTSTLPAFLQSEQLIHKHNNVVNSPKILKLIENIWLNYN